MPKGAIGPRGKSPSRFGLDLTSVRARPGENQTISSFTASHFNVRPSR
jgi:hypothetical protein